MFFLGASGESRYLRHSQCTVEPEGPLYESKWTPLPPDSSEIARHPPRSFELSDADRQALASWKVRPRVVAIEGRSVEILRAPEAVE
jgi:hypothetical protein